MGLGGDHLDFSARQSGHLRVAQPIGGWQQHLIARVEQHLKQVVDGLFATVGDQHLLRTRRYTVFLGELLRHRGPQGGIPGGWAVAGDPIDQGATGGFNDEIGGVEIRFAGTEAADVPAGLLQLLGFGCDR